MPLRCFSALSSLGQVTHPAAWVHVDDPAFSVAGEGPRPVAELRLI